MDPGRRESESGNMYLGAVGIAMDGDSFMDVERSQNIRSRMFFSEIGSVARSALDLLYPRQCQICGETKRCGKFPFLCDICFSGAPYLEPPYCEICAQPFAGLVGPNTCCPNCNGIELY